MEGPSELSTTGCSDAELSAASPRSCRLPFEGRDAEELHKKLREHRALGAARGCSTGEGASWRGEVPTVSSPLDGTKQTTPFEVEGPSKVDACHLEPGRSFVSGVPA